MKDPRCVVEVGLHPGPFWRDRNHSDPDWQVCSRHKGQFEERADEFGPYDWERTDGAPLPAPETSESETT